MSLKDDMTGAALLMDWLGGLEAVHPLVAELRARRCLYGDNGKPCHLNVAPNWWDEHIKEPIAAWIKGELEVKNQMKLSLADDDKLFMCRNCGCCIRLKIWASNEILKRHISQKQIESAPEWCWMKRLI